MSRRLRAARVLSTLVALGMFGSLATPGLALAKSKGVAPPGNSGVSQYMEDLPTAKGSKPTSAIVIPPGGGSGPGAPRPSTPGAKTSGGGSALAPTVTRQLERAGNAGKAAAALDEATASASTIVSRQRPAAATPVAPPTSQILKALGGSTGGGGLGAFLPILLIATLVILSAIGILHRRRAP